MRHLLYYFLGCLVVSSGAVTAQSGVGWVLYAPESYQLPNGSDYLTYVSGHDENMGTIFYDPEIDPAAACKWQLRSAEAAVARILINFNFELNLTAETMTEGGEQLSCSIKAKRNHTSELTGEIVK